MWWLAAAVAVPLVYLYFKTRPPAPVRVSVDYKRQSVVVDEKERIHRSALSPDRLVTCIDPQVLTLYDAFQSSAKRLPNHNCLGFRRDDKSPYEWLSYSAVAERATNFGSGLLSVGVAAGQKTTVGIYCQNRVEWVVAEQAANAYSMILVPLYDTLGKDAVRFICDQAEISVVVCDGAKLPLLLGSLDSCKTIRMVVKIEKVTDAEVDAFRKKNVKIFSMSEIEGFGASKRAPHVPPKPDDLCTVCYTSGTSGDPKGAMLTHNNVISDCSSFVFLLEHSNFEKPVIGPTDVHISYLPLAHVFERVVQAFLFSVGAQVGFFRGDIKGLMGDIAELKPTIFISVPRLLNKVYDKVLAKVEAGGGVKKRLFDHALSCKIAEVEQGIVRRNSIWDLLVFKKIQESLGGRVKFVITGSAPISGKCLTFLRAALGCPVLEGYGQTENAAGATAVLPGDHDTEQVGPPLPVGEIKLVDVPDTDYVAANDAGEICFRGPHVMKGYLKNPEKTSEAIDKDGWLHSGDIGRWLPNGTLKIVDRKKAIFKMSQGEYIAPEKIENVITRLSPIMQVFIYGNSLESALVAIVVPDPETFPAWLKEHVPAAASLSHADACNHPAVNAALFKLLSEGGKKAGLHGFELPRLIKVEAVPFSVENGLLTPTFKSKRNVIEAHYKKDIEAMYAVVREMQARIDRASD